MKKLLFVPFLLLALISCSRQEVLVKNKNSATTQIVSAPKVASLNETKTEIALASNSNAALVQSLSVTPNVQKLVNDAITIEGAEKMNRIQKMRTMIKAKKEIKKVLKANGTNKVTSDNDRSKPLAIGLWFFILLGFAGFHRIYLGYYLEGIIQLLTGGCCGVWAIIDIIRIIDGDLKPKNGNYKD
jgi:hypothetical protein